MLAAGGRREGIVMKNLFEAVTAKELKERIARLGLTSERQWGKMNAPQAMALFGGDGVGGGGQG